MVKSELLEVTTFEGIGYRPLVDYGSWRVAFLRYIDEIHPAVLFQMERHNETDEVFVLLAGQAVLYMGEGLPGVEQVYPVVMKPGVLYNVKRSAWHCVTVSRDATILLVENCDTSRENSDYTPLKREQRQQVLSAARAAVADWADLPENLPEK